jgi:hypothetical protein
MSYSLLVAIIIYPFKLLYNQFHTLDINIDTRKDIKVHEVNINILYENKYTKLTGHVFHCFFLILYWYPVLYF